MKIIKKIFCDTRSEKGLLIFDKKVLILIAVVFLISLIAVSFKISWSSVGFWDRIVVNKADTSIVYGTPKAIRSDEWLVNVPFILSESENEYTKNNKNIGPNKDVLLMNLPVKDGSTILRPQFWGYFVFGAEGGYSFYWVFKYFSILLGFFFLILLFTKKFWISLAGGLWVLFSPFIQWWSVLEVVGIWSLMTFALILFLFSNKKKEVIGASVLLVFTGINFMLVFYPPFQVPLVYLTLVLIITYYLKNKDELNLMEAWKLKLVLLVTVAAISLFFLQNVIMQLKSTIYAISNTAYPGKRIATGGDLDIYRLFSGYFSNFMNEFNFPKIWGNISEASGFILTFPFAIAAIIFLKLKNKVYFLPLILYSLFLTVWMLFKFPVTFSKLTLFSYVPSNRAVIALGATSILLTLFLLAEDYKKIERNKAIYFAFASFATFLIVGLLLKETSEFFRYRWILLVSLTVGAAVYLMLLKRIKELMAVIVGVSVLSTYSVNPMVSGFSAIRSSELSKFTQEKNLKGETAVFGSYLIGQYLMANGMDVFNGVKYTPDLSEQEKLDPEGKYKNIYNRYAHISVQSSDQENPTYVLVQPDLYTIHIDPCSIKLKEVGIQNVVFSYRPSPHESRCLVPIGESENVYFYTYKN